MLRLSHVKGLADTVSPFIPQHLAPLYKYKISILTVNARR